MDAAPECLVISAAILKLESQMQVLDSLLCVGLDPDPSRLPATHAAAAHPLFSFCREIVDVTSPFACAFKINTAFFEAYGAQGWAELEELCVHIRTSHPQHFLICDAKRADIGNTNRGYVEAFYDGLRADALTVHPYLGAEALAPFLERDDRAAIVLCRTSNAGAGELQDLPVEGKPLWEHVAKRVAQQWNARGNCMLVVGATWPEEMRTLRSLVPEMTFLVPGIGAQGGDVHATVHAGLRPDGRGLLLSSSRAILYANDPAQAALEVRDQIRAAREQVHAGH